MGLSIIGHSNTEDSAANTALAQTISGVEGYSHYLISFSVAVSGAALASAVTVQIKDDTTVIYKTIIGAGSPIGEVRDFTFDVPIRITGGNDLILAASAGGAGAVITGNLVYITE